MRTREVAQWLQVLASHGNCPYLDRLNFAELKHLAWIIAKREGAETIPQAEAILARYIRENRPIVLPATMKRSEEAKAAKAAPTTTSGGLTIVTLPEFDPTKAQEL